MASAKTAKNPDPLIALLAVWERSGGKDAKTDAEIVRAIELAGANAARGKKVKGDWLAAAKRADPVERGLLLTTVEEGPREKRVARWAALTKVSDPRVSGRLAQRTAPLARKPELERFLTLLVECARDRRIVDATVAIKERKIYSPDKKRMVAAAITRVKAAHRSAAKAAKTLTAEDKALIEKTIDAHGKASDDTADMERELLAAIYSAPADNGPRTVYADWLLERDDPRGELITLQLANEGRNPSKKDRARMDQLEIAHRRKWLAPLAKLPIGVDFRRGFPYRFEWHEDIKIPDDPCWSTCEWAERMPPKSGQRVLTTLFRALSKDIARLGELADDSPLERINWVLDSSSVPTAAIAAFKRAKLPALRSVDISRWQVDATWAPSKIGWIFEGRALTDVGIPGNPAHLADYVERFEKHAPTLEQLVVSSVHGHAIITEEAGVLTIALSANSADRIESCVAGLNSLPPNFRGRVKISTSLKSARARLAPALARLPDCKVEYTK